MKAGDNLNMALAERTDVCVAREQATDTKSVLVVMQKAGARSIACRLDKAPMLCRFVEVLVSMAIEVWGPDIRGEILLQINREASEHGGSHDDA